MAVKTNFLRPQAQEGSSHRHVPDPHLDSDLELPEHSCSEATPEVTAELLLVYGSQDFPPGKPHLGNPAHRFVMNQGWACRKPPGAMVPY